MIMICLIALASFLAVHSAINGNYMLSVYWTLVTAYWINNYIKKEEENG